MTAPWENLKNPERSKGTIPGQIQPIECQALYWLAGEYYRGVGEIVELGTFLGRSSEALARGLADNGKIADRDKAKRLHCFDRFLYNEHHFTPILQDSGVAYGQSFYDLWRRNMAPYENLIEPNPGDLMALEWCGRPIEILFIDAAKSWELNDRILDQFFRCLIPKVSMVVQQDYLFQGCPWLQITMEKFADYFDLIGNADTSMVFGCARPVPLADLERGIAALSAMEKNSLMDKTIARFSGDVQMILRYARARLLLDLDGGEAARAEIHAVMAATNSEGVRDRGRRALAEFGLARGSP